MQGAGYLAIWSDLAPQDHTDWAHWITREHAAERVGVTGFLACRIFRALGASVNRYFILYELEDDRVVGGPDYLARLNAPTPWSQRIMPRLKNFARGGGRVAASSGIGQGGLLAVLKLDGKPNVDPAALTAELTALDRITAVRVLLTDEAQTSIQTGDLCGIQPGPDLKTGHINLGQGTKPIHKRIGSVQPRRVVVHLHSG